MAVNIHFISIFKHELQPETRHHDKCRQKSRQNPSIYGKGFSLELPPEPHSYAKQEKEGARAFIIMHNNEVAGFTVGMPVEDDALELCLDYSTPAYRDCSVGKFLYEELKHRGIRRFIYTGSQPDHLEYLKKVGFTETKDGSFELK